MPKKKLLIVDDEESICWGLKRIGESNGFDVATASSAEEAIEHVSQDQPDVIVLDVRLPGMDGLSAMHQLRSLSNQAPIIVITAFGDLETAVEAIRQGAFEYITKPFELGTVEQTIDRAWESRSHSHKSVRSSNLDAGKPPEGMIGKSPVMQEVFKRIALATSSDAPVLLCGESGTGKELAARAIHQFGARAEMPFVAVNVAALNPSLAESELFGHERGAFTGADQSREGFLRLANGGTLFLDEVADIPIPLQIKLLRCLENGEVTPVGSNQSVKTDFRIVCATHQDLQALIAKGDFRHDLYFRLSAFQIELPALRDREDDLVSLAEHFIEVASSRSDTQKPVLSQEAVKEIKGRKWQGNVRELQNAIEHAVIVARGGAILPEHLSPAMNTFNLSQGSGNLDEQIAQLVAQWSQQNLESDSEDLYDQLIAIIEPPLLKAALQKHHQQYLSAARSLGLHRTTLKKKVQQHELEE